MGEGLEGKGSTGVVGGADGTAGRDGMLSGGWSGVRTGMFEFPSTWVREHAVEMLMACCRWKKPRTYSVPPEPTFVRRCAGCRRSGELRG